MRRKHPAGSRLGILLTLLAVVVSSVSLGLHAEAEAVGTSSLEPTTIYYSEHSSDSGEEHLHAVTGSELFFCLACILSLRNEIEFQAPAAVLVDVDPGQRVLGADSSTLLSGRRDLFSSRAPPRV